MSHGLHVGEGKGVRIREIEVQVLRIPTNKCPGLSSDQGRLYRIVSTYHIRKELSWKWRWRDEEVRRPARSNHDGDSVFDEAKLDGVTNSFQEV